MAECVAARPEIEICTPYRADGNLGRACNEGIERSTSDWVLVKDWDVVLACHPNVMYLCEEAVSMKPHAGLFTCWTNALSLRENKWPGAPGEEAMFSTHRAVAREIFEQHGISLTRLSRPKCGGYFMLVNKIAWRAVQGFPQGFFGVDTGFCKRLRNNEWPVYRIDGLYVPHFRREPTWIKGVKTSMDFKP